MRTRRGRSLVVPRTHIAKVGRRVRDLATQPGRSADEAVTRTVVRRSVSLAMKLGRHTGRPHEPAMRLVDLGNRYESARRREGERQLSGRAPATGPPNGPSSRQLGREILRQGAGLTASGRSVLEKMARGDGPASAAARRVLGVIEKVRGAER